MTIHNDAYIRMNGGIKLVIDNSNPLALGTSGSGGNVISEDEDNQIIWHVNAQTGNYVVPFTTLTTLTKIPVSISITGAGAGAGRLLLSTYETSSDNNLPLPSEVIHMGSPNNSLHTIDRFWMIDAIGYFIKPTVNLSFGYDDSPNEMEGANTISESLLQAQRFNPAPNSTWGDFAPSGVANTTTNVVSSVTVPPTHFHKTWTLVSSNNPLLIELLSFDAQCVSSGVELTWSTASEVNNDYFSVERSHDGFIWDLISTVSGAGNSSSMLAYQFLDQSASEYQYFFRLTQVDFDGHSESFDQIVSTCYLQGQPWSLILNNGTPEPYIQIYSPTRRSAVVRVMDLHGKQLSNQLYSLERGKLSIPINLPYDSGIYNVQVLGIGHIDSYKVLITNR